MNLPFGEQIHIPDSMLVNKTEMSKDYIKGAKGALLMIDLTFLS